MSGQRLSTPMRTNGAGAPLKQPVNREEEHSHRDTPSGAIALQVIGKTRSLNVFYTKIAHYFRIQESLRLQFFNQI